MTQLLAHLWGDYILQSDWMAENKAKRDFPAAVHAFVYTLCFIPLTLHLGSAMRMAAAIFAINVSHFLIDRYRLARYVVWAKNWMGPRQQWLVKLDQQTLEEAGPWRARNNESHQYPDALRFTANPPLQQCPTGYPPDRPVWLAVWLLIIAGNTLHLTINYLALRYL